SAKAALSYVRSQAVQLNLDENFFNDTDIHVHVPAGAQPKDGPSAGVTLATALVSLISGRPVRSDVAMTGEITLRGKVMRVGGIKEKVLAAHRARLTTVLLPKRNEDDLEDLPDEVREALNFVFLDTVNDALEVALEPALDPDQDSKPEDEA
ncbi:MAG: endopeptidase La, partial [Chloroflexi bacterium]|nr:endopeptidase La [Chloroflexota bacterium]